MSARKVLSAGLIAVEAAAGIYAALVLYLMSVWPVDDALAFQMTGTDWFVSGAARAGWGVVAGALAAGVLLGVNYIVFPRIGMSRKWGVRLAAGVFAAASMAAVAGGVQFVAARPYM